MVLMLSVAYPAMAEDAQERITPTQADDSILSTKKELPSTAPLKQPAMPAGVSPFQHVEQGGPSAAAAPAPTAQQPQQSANFQPKIPFGRGEAATMKQVPSGPRSTEAVPVVSVDSVEASEPAPPTPVEPEAAPNEENAADPTELTSPIFGEEENKLAPRKMLLRALNKVTAQSASISLKPGEKVAFGQLEITGVNCQTSAPTSQTDYAALLEISEHQPGLNTLRPVFKGWMYASSPSITGLEHPIYDIALVECRMMPAAQKTDENDAKSEQKADKKSSKPRKK